MSSHAPPSRAVVVVDGRRTPFLRSGTDFVDLGSHDLGRAAVAGLLQATGIEPGRVQRLVFGRVIPDPKTTNVGREVVFGTDLPDSCVASTVTMACVSSLQATLDVTCAIESGGCDVAIAAGADTASDVPLQFRRPVRKRLLAAQKAKGVAGYAKLLRGLKPSDLLPDAVAIAERSTGETMGQNCERLAKRLRIERGAQDEYALQSHRRAATASDEGLLARQIVAVFPPPKYGCVDRDNGIRGDTTMEKLAELRPVFDKKLGTITAGNASFLSDGGAAVLMCSADAAERLGLQPLARVRASATVALDPLEELLLGPALALPQALARADVDIDDVGVIELHEAFAAQVLAVLHLLADERFCKERLGLDEPVGRIDPERLNAWGGSLSVGHPFGATGARLVTNCAHRMRHERARYGALAACAAGGIGIALVLESV